MSLALNVSFAMATPTAALLVFVGFLGAGAGALSCCVAHRRIGRMELERSACQEKDSCSGRWPHAFAGFRWPVAATSLLLGAAYFASIMWVYGLGVPAFALCVLGVILLVVSLVDIETRIIPNGFVVAIALVWVVSVLLQGLEWGVFFPTVEGEKEALTASASLFATGSSVVVEDVLSRWTAMLVGGFLGSFGIAALVLLFSLVVDALCGRPSVGGGDVKLLFATGLFLGFSLGLLNLLIACALALLFRFFAKVRRACGGAQTSGGAAPIDDGTFPFGPFIALATWFTLIFGQSLLVWWFGFA